MKFVSQVILQIQICVCDGIQVHSSLLIFIFHSQFRTPKTDPERSQLKFRLPGQKVKTSTEAKLTSSEAGPEEDYDGDIEL